MEKIPSSSAAAASREEGKSESDNEADSTVAEDDFSVLLPPKEHIPKVSFSDTFSKVWNDETFHDLALVGDDGVQVTANRFALASRNSVFQNMLLGGCEDPNKKKINVEYCGEVIKAIVEYLHTDSARVLQKIAKCTDDESIDEESTSRVPNQQSLDVTINEDAEENRLGILLSLVAASVFFDMPALTYDAIESICQLVEKIPNFLIKILDLYGGVDGAEHAKSLPRELKESLLHRRFGLLNFEDPGLVGCLKSGTMEEILSCDYVPLCESELFDIVHLWAEYSRQENHGYESCPVEGCSGDENHGDDICPVIKAKATSFVDEHIALEKIEPNYLSTTVASSGLVSTEQLLEAFQTQALAATGSKIGFGKARNDGLLRKRPKYGAKWMHSRKGDFDSGFDDNYCVDYLNVPPICCPGKYQWTLSIYCCGYVVLGVALQSGGLGPFDGTISWGYDSEGALIDRYSNEQTSFPRFGDDSLVTLTLDLLDKERNGTLSASIDGGDDFLLFQDLLSEIEHRRDGFVPCAFSCPLKGNSNIGAIDFKRCC